MLILGASLACICANLGCSTPNGSNAVTPDKTNRMAAQPAVANSNGVLTGSYLHQNVQRNGRITDGANQVVVLDQDMIQTSGAASVRELLIRRGVH